MAAHGIETVDRLAWLWGWGAISPRATIFGAVTGEDASALLEADFGQRLVTVPSCGA